jgi:hypothetical protein
MTSNILSFPITGLERPRVLKEVEVSRIFQTIDI